MKKKTVIKSFKLHFFFHKKIKKSSKIDLISNIKQRFDSLYSFINFYRNQLLAIYIDDMLCDN